MSSGPRWACRRWPNCEPRPSAPTVPWPSSGRTDRACPPDSGSCGSGPIRPPTSPTTLGCRGAEVWADGDALTVVCRGHPGHVRPGLPDADVAGRRRGHVRPDGPRRATARSGVQLQLLAHRRRRPGPPELRRGGGRWQARRTPGRASNRGCWGRPSITPWKARRSVSRVVTVYRPPGHERSETLPVVYATDGGMFAPTPAAARPSRPAWSPVCWWWPPTAPSATATSVPSSTSLVSTTTASTATSASSSTSWPWAEAELGASTDRSERAVFGCSDGGGHALATGRLHRARFGHVIAYSTGMAPEPGDQWDPATAPRPPVRRDAGGAVLPGHGGVGGVAAPDRRPPPLHRARLRSRLWWCEELPAAIGRAWG